MLTTIDFRGRAVADVRRALPRAAHDISAALAVVRPLCEDVRARGADAVRDATARFDGVDVDELRVPTDRLNAALESLDAGVRAALEQAIAMFAYGVEGCPAVDVVTGPGNVYVAAAKRYVHGEVGIDAEAGPTEIAILADGDADPAYVAADLIAQAEHDEHATCLLVT